MSDSFLLTWLKKLLSFVLLFKLFMVYFLIGICFFIFLLLPDLMLDQDLLLIRNNYQGIIGSFICFFIIFFMIRSIVKKQKNEKEILSSLTRLNSQEKKILREMIDQNSKTFYFQRSVDRNNIKEELCLVGLCEKKLLVMGGESSCCVYTVPGSVWEGLLKRKDELLRSKW